MKKLITALALTASLAGCSTVNLRTSDLAHPIGTVGGILLTYRFAYDDRVPVESVDCTLILVDVKTRRPFDYRMRSASASVILYPPVGHRYEFSALDCYGEHRNNFTFSSWTQPAIHVVADKIAVLPPIHFQLTRVGENLSEEVISRDRAAQELKPSWDELPPSTRSRLVSPYTGQALDGSLFSDATPKYAWKVTYLDTKKGAKKGPRLDLNALEQSLSLKPCDDQEWKTNFLWMGHLYAEALYENGGLESPVPVQGQSSYSDAYINCVRGLFAGWKPPVSTKFKLTLEF